MESQFIIPYPGPLLGDLKFSFPEGTHAIGRLDKNSEGLLLLTTNKKITALLFLSKIPHQRTYLVQVKHKVSTESINKLRESVVIKIKGNELYSTPPCQVELATAPDFPPPRVISVHQATTWLRITITEGKFRQLRKMVAAIRHRCLRLVRISIEDMELGNLQPGEIKEVNEESFFRLLKLEEAKV